VSTTISVDRDRCKKDGLCASACPARIFVWEKRTYPRVRDAIMCCWCGQCMAVCPSGAIEHSRLDPERFERIDHRSTLDPEELTEFLRQRRSVRVYKDRPVERELVEKVCTSAGYAPSGAFQGVGWVRKVTVVSGPAKMQSLKEATVLYMRKLEKLLKSPFMKVMARFSDDAKGGMMTLPDASMRIAEWEAGRDAITYDAPAAVFVSASTGSTTPREDCDAALMNILLSAHAHGLGACWNGWLAHAAAADHVSGADALRKLLGLPADHRIVEAATLGWPGMKLHSVPQRETDITWIE
jgi:nitroreductase/NAD-dependent dihydropyrimidine dehydrogenase PreA subunit